MTQSKFKRGVPPADPWLIVIWKDQRNGFQMAMMYHTYQKEEADAHVEKLVKNGYEVWYLNGSVRVHHGLDIKEKV